jgi:FkbM family methyltransferase
MLRRYWQAVVDRLDRPGRRALLVLPGSLWVSLSYRRPCLVYWRDGAWIHHYRGAKIPHAGLGRAAPPDVFTAQAREIFLHGYTPSAGDVVLDVGAGIGAETLLFSRLVGPSGRVVSIEAHPRTYERLERLCRVNRLTNVVPLRLAVSDSDGAVTISDRGSHLRNTMVADEADAIQVPARRLDTIASELGITHVDFLKMNIEGAERPALQGLGALVDGTRHVCISCHDFLADDGGSDDLRTKAFVRNFLRAHGFGVTGRDDAPDPWTRDYLYGVNVGSRSPSTSEQTHPSGPSGERVV